MASRASIGRYVGLGQMSGSIPSLATLAIVLANYFAWEVGYKHVGAFCDDHLARKLHLVDVHSWDQIVLRSVHEYPVASLGVGMVQPPKVVAVGR